MKNFNFILKLYILGFLSNLAESFNVGLQKTILLTARDESALFGYSVLMPDRVRAFVGAPKFDENGAVFDCDLNSAFCSPKLISKAFIYVGFFLADFSVVRIYLELKVNLSEILINLSEFSTVRISIGIEVH